LDAKLNPQTHEELTHEQKNFKEVASLRSSYANLASELAKSDNMKQLKSKNFFKLSLGIRIFMLISKPLIEIAKKVTDLHFSSPVLKF
jgi:hypothetical protein